MAVSSSDHVDQATRADRRLDDQERQGLDALATVYVQVFHSGDLSKVPPFFRQSKSSHLFFWEKAYLYTPPPIGSLSPTYWVPLLGNNLLRTSIERAMRYTLYCDECRTQGQLSSASFRQDVCAAFLHEFRLWLVDLSRRDLSSGISECLSEIDLRISYLHRIESTPILNQGFFSRLGHYVSKATTREPNAQEHRLVLCDLKKILEDDFKKELEHIQASQSAQAHFSLLHRDAQRLFRALFQIIVFGVTSHPNIPRALSTYDEFLPPSPYAEKFSSFRATELGRQISGLATQSDQLLSEPATNLVVYARASAAQDVLGGDSGAQCSDPLFWNPRSDFESLWVQWQTTASLGVDPSFLKDKNSRKKTLQAYQKLCQLALPLVRLIRALKSGEYIADMLGTLTLYGRCAPYTDGVVLQTLAHLLGEIAVQTRSFLGGVQERAREAIEHSKKGEWFVYAPLIEQACSNVVDTIKDLNATLDRARSAVVSLRSPNGVEKLKQEIRIFQSVFGLRADLEALGVDVSAFDVFSKKMRLDTFGRSADHVPVTSDPKRLLPPTVPTRPPARLIVQALNRFPQIPQGDWTMQSAPSTTSASSSASSLSDRPASAPQSSASSGGVVSSSSSSAVSPAAPARKAPVRSPLWYQHFKSELDKAQWWAGWWPEKILLTGVWKVLWRICANSGTSKDLATLKGVIKGLIEITENDQLPNYQMLQNLVALIDARDSQFSDTYAKKFLSDLRNFLEGHLDLCLEMGQLDLSAKDQEIESLTKLKDEAESQVKSLKEENDTLKQTIKELHTKIENSDQRAARAEAEAQQAKAEAQQSKAESQQVRNENQQIRNDMAALQQQVQALTAAQAAAPLPLNQPPAPQPDVAARAQMQRQIESLEAEKERDRMIQVQMQGQIESLKAEKQTIRTEFAEQLAALRQEFLRSGQSASSSSSASTGASANTSAATAPAANVAASLNVTGAVAHGPALSSTASASASSSSSASTLAASPHTLVGSGTLSASAQAQTPTPGPQASASASASSGGSDKPVLPQRPAVTLLKK